MSALRHDIRHLRLARLAGRVDPGEQDVEAYLELSVGPFHGIAAWLESGQKEEEREIITGGRYAVSSIDERAGMVHARLREREQGWPSRS